MNQPQTQFLIDHLGEVAGMGYWYLNLADNAMYWSEHIFKVHGVSPETYTPDIQTAIELYHPDDRQEIQRRVQYVLENKRPIYGKSRIITEDGDIRWIEATIGCKTDEDGNIIALFGTGKDISHDLIARSRFELAMEAANVGLWNWDIEKNQIAGNSKANAIGEASRPEDEKTYTLDEFMAAVHPEDKETVATAFERGLRDDAYVFTYEFRFMTENGTYKWIKSTGRLIERSSDGQPRRMIGLLIDIHESKMAELNLKEAYREAERANRVRGEFLANMSHEVRTPMNGIIGLTDLLLSTPLTEEQREYAELVHRSSNSLLHILNDILDFSKIESGKMEIAPVVFSLPEFIHDIELLYFNRETNQHDFSVHVEENVPRSLYCDPHRLKQVINNLLSNAVKFTPENKKITFSIAVEHQQHEHYTLLFSVKDEGVGIPPEKQTTIFEAFRQADASTSRKYGGTGLGLAISKRLIEQMGGTIWLESEPGVGSTFFFTVKLEIGHAIPAASAETSREALPGLHILVAEDNYVNQKLIVKLLTNAGHTVVLANNGQEAVEQAKQTTYDFILMDIQMPEMNGEAAMKAIKNIPACANVPIVALTAHALAGDRERYLSIGFDGYLSKPINKEQLMGVLARRRKFVHP